MLGAHRHNKGSKFSVLTTHLYPWVERPNAVYARTVGAKKYGSFSSYINQLISKDRGVRPKLGTWKPTTGNRG